MMRSGKSFQNTGAGKNGFEAKIELRHLRYVVEAADRGSFRRAGKSLAINESAISRRIRDLEDEIGTALFVRHHGGVCLTEAGHRFVVRARKALRHINHATVDAAAIGRGETGSIRVGIFSSLSSGFLSELMHTYLRANPSIRCEFIEGAPSTHVAAIQRHLIDVAFLTGEPVAEGCESALLWQEEVFVVMPTGDGLSRKKQVCWSDLWERNFIVSESDPGPEIFDYLVKHLGDLGHHPNVAQHAVGRDNLMHLVAMGQGLTLTSEATIATRFPGVVYRRMSVDTLPFSAIWWAQNDNPALRRLLSLARTMRKAS